MHPFSFWLVTSTCFILSIPAFAGQLDDTIHVDEITVEAPKLRYQPGVKIETLSRAKITSAEGTDAGTLLARYTTLYVRANAGGLSTIHLRGTAPDHTSVMFEGENLNSLTLGHSNMANIPMFFFDGATVQYGGSGAVYGSGAIGGTVQLSSGMPADTGGRILYRQELASFGTWSSGAKIQYSGKKAAFSTKVFYKKSRNNFPFHNTSVYDFEKKAYIDDYQKNAGYETSGLLQEFYYKSTTRMAVSLKYLYTANSRQVQPNMSANYYSRNLEVISNTLHRIWGQVEYTHPVAGKILVRANYFRDFELFNRHDSIITNRITTNLEYEKKFSFNGQLNAGLYHAHILPKVHAYTDITRDGHTDLFMLYSQSIGQRTRLAVNLRQEFPYRFASAFSPALNFVHNIPLGQPWLISFNTSVSRSYRYPTLNDQFWPDGWGNPDLKPEHGTSCDAGAAINYCNGSTSARLHVAGYYMLIDDWIQWMPNDSSWSPENHKKVTNMGLEPVLSVWLDYPVNDFEASLKYAYNNAVATEVYENALADVNQQLPYKPWHMGNVFLAWKRRGWAFSPDASFTGRRQYTEGSGTLKPFYLLNLEISKKLTWRHHGLSLSGRAQNLLNHRYQNIYLYAMPGINWSVSLRYTFNND